MLNVIVDHKQEQWSSFVFNLQMSFWFWSHSLQRNSAQTETVSHCYKLWRMKMCNCKATSSFYTAPPLIRSSLCCGAFLQEFKVGKGFTSCTGLPALFCFILCDVHAWKPHPRGAWEGWLVLICCCYSDVLCWVPWLVLGLVSQDSFWCS